MSKCTSFLLLALVFMAAGCSVFSPQPFSPIEKEYASQLEPPQLLEVLQARQTIHPNLWASGKITLSGEGIEGKKFFHMTLLYQEPDRLRLRGSRMITSTLFEFVINGDQVAVALNRDKQWFEGLRAEMQEYPEATMGLDPILLPMALLIQQEFARRLELDDFQRWGHEGDKYIFISGDADVSMKAFLVRKKDLLVKEAGFYNLDGRLNLRLSYRRYARFNGEILPEELVVSLPEKNLTARVSIKEYKWPPSFHDRVFDLASPPGFDQYPLSRLLEPPER